MKQYGIDNGTYERDYSLDNIRFVLMFTTVFAHLLEISAPFSGRWMIYKTIELFNIPAFIFLFGYHAEFSPKKILFYWGSLYFIFQTAYILFSKYILNLDSALQYTTPYWILWYMMACIFYQIMIPIYDASDGCTQILVLIASFIAALLVGYDDSVGYYLSLSRFFVFQPWFLLGLYCGKNKLIKNGNLYLDKKPILIIVSSITIIISIVILNIFDVPNQLLYGSYSYSKINCQWWMRMLLMIISLNWIMFIFLVIKPLMDKKIMCLTKIGQNTLPVFLMHGFIVKITAAFFPNLVASPWLGLVVTFVILFIFGNEFFKNTMSYISLYKFVGYQIKN